MIWGFGAIGLVINGCFIAYATGKRREWLDLTRGIAATVSMFIGAAACIGMLAS